MTASATGTHRQHRRGPFIDYRTLPSDLAADLTEAKELSRYSYRGLAALTGLSAGYLCRVVNGDRCPRPDAAERIIVALDLDEATTEQLRAEAEETMPYGAALGAGRSTPPRGAHH
jgi:cyanate lyase